MSNTKKGKPIPWLNNGSERSESHRKNLSKSCKGRISPNKGNKYSEEFRKKLSNSSTVKRKVKQIELELEKEKTKQLELTKNKSWFW